MSRTYRRLDVPQIDKSYGRFTFSQIGLTKYGRIYSNGSTIVKPYTFLKDIKEWENYILKYPMEQIRDSHRFSSHLSSTNRKDMRRETRSSIKKETRKLLKQQDYDNFCQQKIQAYSNVWDYD